MSERLPHEPDYIARTIATVRNHRDADNCWPQWANIFADQIEALASALAEAERERATLREELMRVGLLAISDRVDGCISRTVANRIRGIAATACWPDDDAVRPPDPAETLPCGHPLTAVVNADDGTAYCGECVARPNEHTATNLPATATVIPKPPETTS